MLQKYFRRNFNRIIRIIENSLSKILENRVMYYMDDPFSELKTKVEKCLELLRVTVFQIFIVILGDFL
jgi:hypothetical protein